jgi:hypothetical protein
MFVPGLYEEHGLVEIDAQLLAEEYCSHLKAATMSELAIQGGQEFLRLEPHLSLLAHERMI